MDDNRTSLLPVFLQEAQRKLPVVKSFLATCTSGQCDSRTMEDAYRAAHTLKGSAGLVRAETIRAIALRVEKNLERHIACESLPSPSECDALNLALDKMTEMISCIENSDTVHEGSSTGVFQALDLAEAFSGLPPTDTVAPAENIEDPFADDDAFDRLKPATAQATLAPGAEVPGVFSDLFADDDRFELHRKVVAAVSGSQGDTASLYADPFVEDSVFDLPGLGRRSISDLLMRSEHDQKEAPDFQYCLFSLGARQLSLPISHMIEIADLPKVVELPLSPDYIHGMVNLRGEVIPVVDLAGCSGEPSPAKADRRMVVAEVQGERFAFLCDGIPELVVDASGDILDPVEFVNRYRLSVT